VLNQLLRFTLVSSLLLWLRPRWRGLLALAAFVVLVQILHGEFLGYVALSGDRAFLPWSYLVKWLALLLAVAIYIFLAVVRAAPRARRATPARAVAASALSSPQPVDDGFDFLRQKKQLQSRADKLLDSKLKQ